MNFLIVNDIWSVKGGTERRLIDYEQILNNDGHKVYVQTSERFDDVDYSIIDIAEFHNLFYYGHEIFTYFMNHHPDKAIFYPHDYYPICRKRILGRRILGKFRRCNKPGIFRCIQCVGLQTYLQTNKMLKIYMKTKSIKLVSNFMKNKYSTFGFRPKRFLIDIPIINSAYRILPNGYRINNLIGFSGRDVEYKGFYILREALDILSSCGIDFQFEHTGDDNWFSLEEMVEFYNRVRVIVVPSIWEEPFGVVIPEAKACGALVVGSDIGGIREANPDFLFKPGDAAGLADILRRILEG